MKDNCSLSFDVAKQESDEDPPQKKCTLDVLNGDYVDLNTTNASNNSIEFELDSYLKESVTIRDPLQWWKVCAPKFPRIVQAAKIFLAIPATSISSERTFSAAGLTVNKLRSSLFPETVDHIVFVNKNLKPGVKKLIASNFTIPNDSQENELEHHAEPAAENDDFLDENEVSGEIQLSDLPYEVKEEILQKK